MSPVATQKTSFTVIPESRQRYPGSSAFDLQRCKSRWIPAFTGMTPWGVLIACLLFFLTACTTTPEPLHLHGESMGTTWQVTAYTDPSRAPALCERIDTRLGELIAQMSAWEPDSDLSRFNRADTNTWHTLPPDLFAVIQHAKALSEQTRGAYDPTIAPLVDLWGFGAQRAPRTTPPSEAEILAAHAVVGAERLHLDVPNRRALQSGELHLDVNSLAPGYAVDAISAVLHDAGVHAFLVELGGEMRASGHKPDGSPWRVAVERPDMQSEDFDTIVNLSDAALGTSGDYRVGFMHEGRRYSHTLDPRSGAPVDHALAAVTVIAPEAMAADAMAAALMVLGPERGAALARKHGLDALFLLRDDEGNARGVGVGRLFSEEPAAIASARGI